MRRKHTEKQIEKNKRKRSERQENCGYFLRSALSLASHVAAIVGTVVAVVDLIRHW